MRHMNRLFQGIRLVLFCGQYDVVSTQVSRAFIFELNPVCFLCLDQNPCNRCFLSVSQTNPLLRKPHRRQNISRLRVGRTDGERTLTFVLELLGHTFDVFAPRAGAAVHT